MAASSTDAYSNSNSNNASIGNNIPLFNNCPVVSVTTGPNNFWPGDAPSNSTSPSSDHNWEVDEEEAVKRKIYELKRQFHNGRFLIVRHLPRDATEEDVRSLLNGYLVHSVQMNALNGSARVLLAEPEVLETWAKSSQHILRGQKVTISPSNTEGLLCVARLPQDYLEEDFSMLVSSFGETNYSFLMRSEKNGESKGYGFVEYVNKEGALHARAALDGRELGDTTLVCEWLDPSHVTFASLHSTTLYVDCLPKDYRHMGEFRTIFSKIGNPPYCQIAMMNGAIQNWGLVEFKSPDEAEETRNLLNGFKLQGHPIRVSYYVPGVRAINIYMKLLNDPGLKKRGALLPEPPTNKVFTQLRNLTKHNPAFAKSLQNIILTQIQSLQQKSLPSPPVGSSPTGPVLKGGRMVAPPPNMPLQLHLQHQFHTSHLQNPPPVQPPAIPPPADKQQQPLNSNAQAALILLLAAQLQQQQEQQGCPNGNVPTSNASEAISNGNSPNANNSNILSNPQILSLLQTLVSQGDPHRQSQHTQHQQQPPPPQQQQHPDAKQQQLPSQQQRLVHQPQPASRNGFPPVSLANGHTNSTANILSTNLKNNFRNGYFKNGASKLPKGPLLPTPVSSAGAFPAPEDSPGLDLDGGVTPILTDILDGIKETPKEDLTASIATLLTNTQSLHHLLGCLNPEGSPAAPALTGMSLQHSIPTSVAAHPPPPTLLAHPPPLYQSPHQTTTDPVMSLLLRAAENGRPETTYLSPVEAPPPFLLAPPRVPPPPTATSSWTVSPTPAPLIHAPTVFPQHTTAFHPRLYSPTIYLTPGRGVGHPQSPVLSPNPFQLGMSGFSTPVGQKRKSSHFLPSPEPSPENGYVGQHSQGIGGHYPDSYMTKKKKKH